MSKTHSIILQGIQREQLPSLGFAHDTFGEKAVAKDRATSIGGRKRAVRQRTNVPFPLIPCLKMISVNGEEQSYFNVNDEAAGSSPAGAQAL